MKRRKYEVVLVRFKRNGLVVTVEVQDPGVTWGFDLLVPAEMIDAQVVAEMVLEETKRRNRMRYIESDLSTPLF